MNKDIEAIPVCSRSALESEYKNKNREVKGSTRRDKRSHIKKLAKSAEEAAFVDDLEVYKITKELVNATTKADPPVLDLIGNILPTVEEKLIRWREYFVPVLNHVVGLWMTLRCRCIPNKIVSVIKSTYNGAKCRVLHNVTLSASFVVGSGVRQGCILSPVLLLLVIGDIIQASIAKYHSVCKYADIRWKTDSFFSNTWTTTMISVCCRIVSLMQQTCFIHLKMRQLLLYLKSTLQKQSP